MNPPAARSRPYWLLLVLAALLLSPPAWAVGAMTAAGLGAAVLTTVRRARASRREAQDASDGVALGSGRDGSPVELSDRQLSAHALIVGASGAGKTTTMLNILTDQIRRGRPVVAIDMKGSPSFARTLADAAAAVGRPFAIWTPDGPSQWNPLQHGNASELKDKLIATERFTEPHYQRAAERYVQNVLQVLQHAHPDRAPTLSEVVELMDPRRMPAMFRHIPRPLAERVQDYLAGMTPDQLSAIRGLGTRLAILTESHTGQFLGSPSAAPNPGVAPIPGAPLDLRRALEGGEVVLFSLNASTYGKLSAQLGTLAIQDLVTAAGNKLNLPEGERAMIAIDEFSALGSDQVLALLARGREAGVTVLLATQELADLDRAGKGLRDQVLGVTAVKIAHRQDVPSSALTIAEMAGTERTWEETRQIGSPFGRGGNRGTRRLVKQFVIDPNEIKSLRTGEAVVMTKVPDARARIVRMARRSAREGPEL